MCAGVSHPGEDSALSTASGADTVCDLSSFVLASVDTNSDQVVNASPLLPSNRTRDREHLTSWELADTAWARATLEERSLLPRQPLALILILALGHVRA